MGREEKEILAESLGINFIYVREGKLSFYNEKKSQKKKRKKRKIRVDGLLNKMEITLLINAKII